MVFPWLVDMVLTKTLVAVRKIEDLNTVRSFLREHGEHPKLIVAYLKLSGEGELGSLRFPNPLADPAIYRKCLEGFNFEIVPLEYDGARLSASVYVERALKDKCDSILVVSNNPKTLFTADLAATLAVESPLPVMVIKP